MSGGADSALGVLESRRRLGSGDGHILVSHVGPTMIAPIQRNVAEAAEWLVPGPWQEHRAIRLVRGRKQVDGSRFKSEPSTRSRSLLFLSLGLAVASVHDVPLWIPENGFASLNPPLAPNRRGSLSTRTTHPAFLVGLSTILERVGAQHEIVNPFAEQTKGEMFANAARALDTEKIGAFLSDTHSCGLTGQRAFGVPVSTHCGVCFGCVVRRSSFASAGLIDGTEYLSDTATGDLKRWLSEKSVLPDMRGFTRRGVSNADIASMSLPGTYPTATARTFCERAVNELWEPRHMRGLPSIDMHAHIDVGIEPSELTALHAVVFAACRSLDEAEVVLARTDGRRFGERAATRASSGRNGPSRETDFEDQVLRTSYVAELGLDGKSRVAMDTQVNTLRTALEVLTEHPRITSLHSYEATEELISVLGTTTFEA